LGLLRCQIQKFRPDLVIFNSGTLLDGLALLEVINAERIPYVVVTHLVSTDNWPDDHQAMCIQETYSGAIETNFVSEHNRHLFFMQTGCVLGNSSIVRNPFLVRNSRCPMPSIDNSRVIRLALPARLHPRTKGQDILFEVLSRKHWRESQIRVSLFGTGGCERSLKDVCSKMNLNEMVTFAGHVDDMNAVWETHHGLILPSRHEGLPIALIEAMWAGRVVIATPAGGIPEMIIPEKTGFLATACHADALDIALREAWSNLSKWQEMGDEAHRFIRNQIPHDPAISWAEHLTSLVEQSKKASTS
jgi:glycosyltransferase involved in cell wall biosynthesis